jgi:hypothetical protein
MSIENFDGIIQSIVLQLQEEREVLEGLEVQIAEARERVSRLEKSRRALIGEPAQGKARQRGRPKKGEGNGWTPSPESVRAILTVVSEAAEPLPIKEIERLSGWSHSHVDSTVRYLRRHEMIRLAGRDGTANLYAPMPNQPVLKEAEDAANAV